MATSIIKHENALNITPTSYTASSSINIRSFSVFRSGNVVVVNLYFDVTTALSNNQVMVSFANALPQPCGAYAFTVIRSIGGNVGSASLERADATKIKAWGAVPAGTYYYVQFVYIVA